MSNNFGYLDLILLVMIAGFIILRLRNVLGRKTGHQGKVVSGFSEKKFEEFKKTIKPKTSVMKPGIISNKAAKAIDAPEIISK